MNFSIFFCVPNKFLHPFFNKFMELVLSCQKNFFNEFPVKSCISQENIEVFLFYVFGRGQSKNRFHLCFHPLLKHRLKL